MPMTDFFQVQHLVTETLAWRGNPRHRGPWSPELRRTLETNQALAPALLDLLLTRYAPDGRQQGLAEDYGVCLELLDEALTQVRYSVERQRPWALAMAEQIQLEIAENGFRPEVDVRVQHDLLQALHNAKLPLHPCIQDQAAAVGEYYARFSAGRDAPDLESLLDRLVQETRAHDPFELLELLLAQLTIMPAEAKVMLAAGMMTSAQSLLNDLAVLFLLHPETQVRSQLPAVYRQADAARHLSPLGLRRLIGLRNWVPADERPDLDTLIKQVRVAGVTSAPLPPAQTLTVYASPFDGSGAQGVWFFAKDKRHYRIAGVLVKQGFGIREAWGEGGLTKREMDGKIRELVRTGTAFPVHRDYLDRLVTHFVAVGLERQAAAPPQLLAVNELMGGDYWKPQCITPATTIAELAASDPGAFTPARVQQVLAAGAYWPQDLPLAASWFEDDTGIDELLHRKVGKKPEDWLLRMPLASRLIVDQILEPKRGVWTERLLWMARWAQAAQSRPPVPWQDFLIVASALHEDTPLAQVPLMEAIATRSVQSAYRRSLTR